VSAWLTGDAVQTFLRKVVDVGFKRSSSNWFARQEIHFVRLVIEIGHQVGQIRFNADGGQIR
jgi:hypothetical protein